MTFTVTQRPDLNQRIATVPLLVYLLMFPGPMPAALAAGVFFSATITDFLDGYIARSYGSGTDLGKFLDPLADKLIVTRGADHAGRNAATAARPAWMVVVLVSREILVTGLRAVAAADGRIIGAEELGKYKMALQSIAMQGLLIHYTYFHVDFFAAGMFVLWIATGAQRVVGHRVLRQAVRARSGHRLQCGASRTRAAGSDDSDDAGGFGIPRRLTTSGTTLDLNDRPSIERSGRV